MVFVSEDELPCISVSEKQSDKERKPLGREMWPSSESSIGAAIGLGRCRKRKSSYGNSTKCVHDFTGQYVLDGEK